MLTKGGREFRSNDFMNDSQKENLIYVLKKLVQVVITLFCLSIIVFVIARLCPGDPLKAYYGDGVEHMSTEEKYEARDRLGLNDSMVTQYFRWGEGLVHGDLGISYKYKQPVGEVISSMWMNTLVLGLVSYVLVFGLATLLGMFCALNENTRVDRIICRIGTVSTNIPSFFLAMILILIFAVTLGILPTGGAYSLGGGGFFDRLTHLILPVSVLVIEHLWYYAYMVRNKLLEETRKDYVLVCKAQGIPKKRILTRNCFLNIMPSMLVIMAISLPHILGGTYVVETVFGYPGLGSLSFEAAMYKDYNMLMALTMITGTVVVIFNIIAQIISHKIDPRMEYERVSGEVRS